MKKFIYILSALFLTCPMTLLRAQEDGQFSQFYANKLYFNPAAMQNDDVFRVSLTDREQWWGKNVIRPSYRLLNASQFFTKQNMGVGLSFYQYNQNTENTILVRASYAYHLQVAKESYLAFGINLGYLDAFVKGAVTPSGNTEIDDQLGSMRKGNMDLGLGIEFYTKEIQTGISVQHIPIRLTKNSTMLALHSYFYFGYNYEINQDWSLLPMLTLRTAASQVNLDVNLRCFYKDIVHFGASYRLDAVALMAGVNIGKYVSLSYACDININKATVKLMPSHEFILSFRGCFMCKDSNVPLLDKQ